VAVILSGGSYACRPFFARITAPNLDAGIGLAMPDSFISACERAMVAKQHLFRLYGAGLACTFAGAWLTEITGSFLPLAMGASVTLMCTVQVIRALRAQHARRRGRAR
jgi:hypothetical protein